MNPNALEERLRQLGDTIRGGPSVAQDVMRRIEQTSIAPAQPTRFRRFRIMHSRTIKWLIPVAAAAAVLVAVGLWPHDGRNRGGGLGSGYAYAISDLPGLLRKARTMYMKVSVTERDPKQPDKEPIRSEGEMWLDLEKGRSLQRRPADPECSNAASLGDVITACDGQYVMQEYISRKAGSTECSKRVRFRKLTPFQSLLRTRDADGFFRTFGSVDRVAGFENAAQETRDGTLFNIWEAAVDSGAGVGTVRVWLAPTTGRVGRVQMVRRLSADAPDWVSIMDYEGVELDVPMSDELFSTEMRPDCKPENTKQNAPTTLLGGSGLEDVEPYGLHRHVSFVLPDSTVLLGWSVWDQQSPDQQTVFEDLVPGGDLPQLPARVMSLSPLPLDEGLVYVGRHLADTRIKGRCIEWSLYVPKQTPPAGAGLLSFRCEVQFNADKDRFGTCFEGINPDLEINSGEDFDTLVRGAMADMSDGGVVPENVTYERVMALCGQIRASLNTQPEPGQERETKRGHH